MILNRVMNNGVRQLIRQRIQANLLPRDQTIELWHGPYLWKTCDGCGLAIAPAERMSLLCADDWKVIRLHAACFDIWAEERRVVPTARKD